MFTSFYIIIIIVSQFHLLIMFICLTPTWDRLHLHALSTKLASKTKEILLNYILRKDILNVSYQVKFGFSKIKIFVYRILISDVNTICFLKLCSQNYIFVLWYVYIAHNMGEHNINYIAKMQCFCTYIPYSDV